MRGITRSRDITGNCWVKNHDKGKVIVSSMGWMISAIDYEGKVPLVLALNCGWLKINFFVLGQLAAALLALCELSWLRLWAGL